MANINNITPHCHLTGYYKYLTLAGNVFTAAKAFASIRGVKSIETTTGIMWNCVVTFGIRSTDVFVLQALIDVLKEKIRTGLLHLDDDCSNETFILIFTHFRR